MATKKTSRGTGASSPGKPVGGESKLGTVIGLVSALSPLAVAAFRKLSENPELFAKVQGQLERLLKNRGGTASAMRATVDALRDQVSYLKDSADDDAERKRATAWEKQLADCEHAIALLDTPAATRKHRKVAKKRIASLHDEIVTAFLIEQEEDARAAGDISGKESSSEESPA